MSTFSKIFSETAWLIKLKFYVEPPWVGERKFVHGILDLDPWSFKLILCFLSEITWPIKLIFYVEPSWIVALIFSSR